VSKERNIYGVAVLGWYGTVVNEVWQHVVAKVMGVCAVAWQQAVAERIAVWHAWEAANALEPVRRQVCVEAKACMLKVRRERWEAR